MALDLGPAADQLAALVAGVRDDQLADPTPCASYTVGDLLDHIGVLVGAFTEAARKTGPPVDGPPPQGDAASLDPEWRTTFPPRLRELAAAWEDPAASDGMTSAGGIEMPGEIAGMVVLEELTVHGWDLAKATGQPFAPDDAAVEAVIELVAAFPDDERADAYAPAVAVDRDASRLDTAVALTGRDPAWAPA